MFCSAAIDLLSSTPDADEEWIEEFLVQVMLDEFEVAVDDGSAGDVADQIVALRKQCEKGDFEGVRELERRWASKGGKVDAFQRGEDEEGSTDGSDDEDDEGDVDMDEAPSLVETREPREPVAPEVDEDGFTKVTKKKR